MRQLFYTDNSWAGLILRVTLGLVMFLSAADKGYQPAQEAVFQLYTARFDWSSYAAAPGLYADYLKRATAGDIVAMTNVAMMRQWGVGTAADLGDAVRWYQRAVDGGDARAMAYLGRIHEFDGGSVIAPDAARAMQLYRQADKLGNGAVFKRLGFLASRAPSYEALVEACAKRLTAGNAKLDPALACPRLVRQWRLWVPDRWKRRGPS